MSSSVDGRPLIVVVGGLNMDIHLFGSRSFEAQGLLVADQYLIEPGGKGANQARAAARLGASVRLIGMVGDDDWGRANRAAVARDGVDVSAVGTASERSTGLVVIELVNGQHETRVLVPGANALLDREQVDRALTSLDACDGLMTQAEIPPPVLDGLARFTSATGTPLYLDPSPPSAVTSVALGSSEIVTPDVEEASKLAGLDVTDEETARAAAARILEMGARRVVIKLDDLGALLADRDSSELIPTIAVAADDETGAGDVFVAALAVARAEGRAWRDAVTFANTASALSVSRHGLYLPERELVNSAMGSAV